MDGENTTSNCKRYAGHSWLFPLRFMWQRIVLCYGIKRGSREDGRATRLEASPNKDSGRLWPCSQGYSRLSCLGGILITLTSGAYGADFEVSDGIPNRTNDKDKEVMQFFWHDDTQTIEPEVFAPPVILRDFGKVEKIFESPVEASRLVESIPTASLAKWHWWLLKDDVLSRVIRQYAKCVARLAVYQELFGEMTYEDPRHPYFGLIKETEEYLPAFEVVQPFDYERGIGSGVPIAGARHYKENIRAAIDSINGTVDKVALCESTEAAYKAKFNYYYRRIR